jgi:hypothetical protein
MVYLVVVHFEYFSLFSLFAWEKVAVVSSAEGFVLLSGLVVGMVYRRRLEKDGLKQAAKLLWHRALTLYRVNVVMIASIALLGLLPFVDVFEVTHWTRPGTEESYRLFPPADTSLLDYVWQTLLLKIGPHQYQIIGLYVVLLAFSPVALYLLAKRQTAALMLISWALYGANAILHFRITGARFEFGFPTLTWQLLFIHGLIAGFHREQVLGYLVSHGGRWLFHVSWVVILLFAFITNNNPGSLFWPWGHWSLIPADTYGVMYRDFFDKTTLGLGRILNNLALFVASYVVLDRYWRIFNAAAGWLLIPLGQNSLYVFTLHIYAILLVSNTVLPSLENFWVNSAIHAGVILMIAVMVKQRILFGVIPR